MKIKIKSWNARTRTEKKQLTNNQANNQANKTTFDLMLQDGAQSKPTLDPPGLRLQHKRGQWGGGLDALLFFLLHTNIWTLLYTNNWTCYYLSTSHFILHTHYFSLYLTHIFGRTIRLMIYVSYFCMWYLFSCFILNIWTHYLSFYFILDICSYS